MRARRLRGLPGVKLLPCFRQVPLQIIRLKSQCLGSLKFLDRLLELPFLDIHQPKHSVCIGVGGADRKGFSRACRSTIDVAMSELGERKVAMHRCNLLIAANRPGDQIDRHRMLVGFVSQDTEQV